MSPHKLGFLSNATPSKIGRWPRACGAPRLPPSLAAARSVKIVRLQYCVMSEMLPPAVDLKRYIDGYKIDVDTQAE